MKHFYQTNNNLSDVISMDNYFPFAEVITLHELKVHACRNYKVFYLYSNLAIDIHNTETPGYILSDSFDILQEVAFILYQNIGKKLCDITFFDNKEISIKKLCIKIIANKIYQIKKLALNTTSLNEKKNIDNEPFYEPEFDDNTEINFDIDNLLDKLNLEPIETEIINCLIANMKYIDIVKFLNCNPSRPWNVKYKLQQKLAFLNK